MSLVLPDVSVVFYYSLILTRFFLIIGLFFGNFFVSQDVVPKSSVSLSHMEATIKAIRTRILARLALQQQLRSLGRNRGLSAFIS